MFSFILRLLRAAAEAPYGRLICLASIAFAIDAICGGIAATLCVLGFGKMPAAGGYDEPKVRGESSIFDWLEMLIPTSLIEFQGEEDRWVMVVKAPESTGAQVALFLLEEWEAHRLHKDFRGVKPVFPNLFPVSDPDGYISVLLDLRRRLGDKYNPEMFENPDDDDEETRT
jgi:hypothetical protein